MTPEQAQKTMHDLLRMMIQHKASDLFIADDFPPAMKINGKMTPVGQQKLNAVATRALAYAIMRPDQKTEFEEEFECNFAISPEGIGRFRVNVFMQQEKVGMVLRTITSKIPNFDEMGLPKVLKEVMMSKRGLVLLVGGTGSGKSTTMAAMIDYRNEHSHGHIITIEDPVEYLHKNKNCLVTHREVGRDTKGWFNALKNTLRQAPDVILIGEIRDRETMEYAMNFAETGHLCMGTLHANSSNQALERIVNFFPEERHPQLYMDLSLNMRGIISQRLVPTPDGKGRCAAIEILLNTPLVADMIFKGDVGGVKTAMQKSRELGMQTFDMALFDLYEAGKISMEEALKNADSLNELRLNIKLNSQHHRKEEHSSGLDHLSLEVHEEPVVEMVEDAAENSAG
ncbi:PilT/PilU family type 4a pilus ATPase [Chitinibacter bivalviorum]|uniref:PilT/PilU family type 4a pilus ATPase n=1 Tax=Chitinibacter bivalviorum TaxID=2739434 RepID=A0A7H9BLS9_9NEIS|nr:PilT/PilU family type 4a pilus ATPase [Chitinibacter bivalviorum]QLG89382.1 PilT/PilU family type 4a pilus ATPase [Chitinibacter bivalviorum]